LTLCIEFHNSSIQWSDYPAIPASSVIELACFKDIAVSAQNGDIHFSMGLPVFCLFTFCNTPASVRTGA